MPLSGRAEIVIAEPVARQAPGSGRDHDSSRRRLGLQPRCQVGRLADHPVCLAAAYLADHDQPGGDADAGIQW